MPLRTLVVVPTYNEIGNVDALVETLRALPVSIDVLFVDDASPDGTGVRIDEWAKRDTRIAVLHRPGKMGLGTAYIAGFRYAIEKGYEAVCEMDADFSHNPAYIPEMLGLAQTNDLVIGSRYIPRGGTVGWGLHRKVLSAGANLYARTLLGIDVRDCTAGFRCYRVDVLKRIDLGLVLAQGYSFQVEMLVRVLGAGGRVKEFPITFEERRHGRSKISRNEVWRAIGTVLRLMPERWRR